MTKGIIEERSHVDCGATPSAAEVGRLRRVGRDSHGVIRLKGGV